MEHVLKPREAMTLFLIGKGDCYKPDMTRPSDFETTDTPYLSRWCLQAKSLQPCLTLGNPVDSSPARLHGIHGILQARILEWVAMSSLLQGIFPTQGSNSCLLCLLYSQTGSTSTTWEAQACGNKIIYNIFTQWRAT